MQSVFYIVIARATPDPGILNAGRTLPHPRLFYALALFDRFQETKWVFHPHCDRVLQPGPPPPAAASPQQ